MARVRGDSEGQALLRDQMIKKKTEGRSVYVSKILSVMKPRMRVLDIGCGTAHIVQEMAACAESSLFIGLDISAAMLRVAFDNTLNISNVGLVDGDGCRLPFSDASFDVVITRLADYSSQEAHRVLKRKGIFFECGLGPEADKEIRELFPERIERESFFFPRNLRKWKEEVCEDVVEAGFVISSIEDFKEDEHFETEEELMNLIEMVPLVKHFDRENDRKKIMELMKKYGDEEGARTTWHYYILIAQKP